MAHGFTNLDTSAQRSPKVANFLYYKRVHSFKEMYTTKNYEQAYINALGIGMHIVLLIYNTVYNAGLHVILTSVHVKNKAVHLQT